MADARAAESIRWKSSPAIRSIIADAVRDADGDPELSAMAVVNELNRASYKIVPDPLEGDDG